MSHFGCYEPASLAQGVLPQLSSFRRLETSVSLHGVIKGGAGFASKDNPLVCVTSSCMVMLTTKHDSVIFYAERRCSSCWQPGFVSGLPPCSVLSPAGCLICAVPAGCQPQSPLLYCTFNQRHMHRQQCHQSQGVIF